MAQETGVASRSAGRRCLTARLGEPGRHLIWDKVLSATILSFDGAGRGPLGYLTLQLCP